MRLRIVAVAALCLAAVVPGLMAGDFFPGSGGSFFKEPILPSLPSVALPNWLPLKPAPGTAEPKAGAAPSKQYNWYFGPSLMGSYQLGSSSVVAGLNAEWSPVAHLGIGARVGVFPLNPRRSMRGPAQQYWYLVKDSFEVVDGMDTTYHQQLYQLEYPSPVAVAGLRLAAYLGNKGLEGLFAAADVSIFRTIQGVRFYPGWASEQAVKHIGGGDVPLPQYASNYGIILAPHVGYRLIVKGFALEAGVGYMAMSHELGNGISIHLGAGYALGKE